GAWVSDESRVLVSPAFEEVQAVFPGKADPAGELDEIMQEVGGTLRHAQLCDGDHAGGIVVARGEKPGRLVDGECHTACVYSVIGESVLHCLEPADRPSKGLSFARVVDRALEHALNSAHGVGGQKEPEEVRGKTDGPEVDPLVGIDRHLAA
ncbi:MAG: hypothetical protein ACI9C1_001345, partial [Candidatus Aldehydirespiratoraceae bacterium]